MCGRFVTDIPADQLRKIFNLIEVPRLEPRFNVTPSQFVGVVRNQVDHNRLDFLKWGLVPGWSKDPGIGSQMINARSEDTGIEGVEIPYYWHHQKGFCLGVQWHPESIAERPEQLRLFKALIQAARHGRNIPS